MRDLESRVREIVREEIAAALADHDRGREGLISVTEAADRLGVSASTIRKRIARGALPAQRVGRRVLIAPADLGSITERRRPTAPDTVDEIADRILGGGR